MCGSLKYSAWCVVALLSVYGFCEKAEAQSEGYGPVSYIGQINGGGTHGQGLGVFFMAVRLAPAKCATKPLTNSKVTVISNLFVVGSQALTQPGFAVDLGVASGRAMYSVAKAAFLSGESLTVYGANSCKLSSKGVEDVQFLLVPYRSGT
jgi:hypothetical protein